MMEASIANQRMVTRSKLTGVSDKPTLVKDSSKRLADPLPDVGNKKRILGDITNQPKASNLKSNLKKGGKNTISESDSCITIKNESPMFKSTISGKESSKYENITDESTVLYRTAFGDSSIPEVTPKLLLSPIPKGVDDFDKSCQKDPFNESRYAKEIFNYYLEREKKFPVKKYLDLQRDMTKGMRAVLIDWMVEVQESFELNHETLYLSVKLVDQYLMKNYVKKSELQLIGATAICVAAKFDERQPPLVDDFLYVCDDSYTREQLIGTEIKILETVDFDLGIPLSYRFLRRYARCSRMSMELLTLARYILETSLMDFELIETLDSKLAAAALLLALKMKQQEWTPTNEYYTGYKESDLKDIVYTLNRIISAPPNNHLQTIRTKYSHQVFFEVAKIPPLTLPKPEN